MRFKAGFTIIELMIVVAIMSILGGFGIASYNTMSNQKEYDAEVNKLMDVIETSKKRAFANEGSIQCNASNTTYPNVHSYLVTIAAGGYTVHLKCDSNSGTINPTPFLQDSYQLDAKVQASAGTIEFKSPTEGTTTSGMPIEVTSLKLNNKTTCITVSPLGVIRSVKC